MMNRENLQASLKRDLKPSTTDKLVCQSCTMVPVELKENDSCTLNSVDANPLLCLCSGGWALTRVTPQPALVGHSLEVTCLVRGKRPLSEVIFYRDGVEVMRNQGNNPKFFLSNVTIEDQGMYSCRASWVTNSQTHSVISVDTPGRVRGNFLPPNANIQIQLLQSANNVFFLSEVLSEPVLEINVNKDQIPNRMKLICHHEYNLPAPAPPLHFYFYKNNNRLGTATSENQLSVRQTPGRYCCKVRVPALNLVRWSEPKSFEQMPGI